jgi:hypothetical protein
MPSGQSTPFEQEVSQAFRAAPRVISEDPADSSFEKTLAAHPLHVRGATPGTLQRLTLFANFLRYGFCVWLFDFVRQNPLPDGRSDCEN